MASAPIMPVFTDALLGDTTHLSLEEFGAYCLLLIVTWRNNGVALEDDDKLLARICRVTPKRWRERLRPQVIKFFDTKLDGRLHQKRLEKEWLNVAKHREKMRSNGAQGGRPKSLKNNETGKPKGYLQHNLNETNPNPNPKEDSEAKASAAAAAPAAPPDPVKALWDKGLELLLAARLPQARARSLVGGWRKEFSDEAVMSAIVACEKEAASEPVAFIAGCLHNSRKGTNGHDRRSTAAGDRMRAGFQAIIDADREEDLLSGAGVNGCYSSRDPTCVSTTIGAEPRQSSTRLEFSSADLSRDPKGFARRSH